MKRYVVLPLLATCLLVSCNGETTSSPSLNTSDITSSVTSSDISSEAPTSAILNEEECKKHLKEDKVVAPEVSHLVSVTKEGEVLLYYYVRIRVDMENMIYNKSGYTISYNSIDHDVSAYREEFEEYRTAEKTYTKGNDGKFSVKKESNTIKLVELNYDLSKVNPTSVSGDDFKYEINGTIEDGKGFFKDQENSTYSEISFKSSHFSEDFNIEEMNLAYDKNGLKFTEKLTFSYSPVTLSVKDL